MRSSFGKVVLLFGAFIASAFAASAQTRAASIPSSVDLAVTYDASQANTVPGSKFWMQGGSVQFHGQFWRDLGVVADVAGLHTGDAHGTGVGLNLVTATFGPRYTWTRHRYALFGQALAGEAFGFDSAFPSTISVTTSADSMAVQAGGGMNLRFSRRIYLRAFEADWLRTQLPNATTGVQNSLRIGTGLVLKF